MVWLHSELSVEVKLNNRQVLSYLTLKDFVISLCFVACLLGWTAADSIHTMSLSPKMVLLVVSANPVWAQ